MFILTLTQFQANAALTALGGFLDNEHDKGCDESPMVEAAEQMVPLLAKSTSVDLGLLQLATLQYACESQGGDEGTLDDDGDDPEYTDMCLAMRAVNTAIDMLLVGR